MRSCCVGAWRLLSVWTSHVFGLITSWPKEKFIACSAASIAQSSLTTCPHRAAGFASLAASRPFWRLIPILVLPQTFHSVWVIWLPTERAPRKAAVLRFSVDVGLRLSVSKEVPCVALWTIVEAALKAVPSSRRPLAWSQSFVALPVQLRALYDLCQIVTIFLIVFASLTHLAALAPVASPLNIPATIAPHIPPVATAIATVIAISTMISPASFAFSSLRSQSPYPIISL